MLSKNRTFISSSAYVLLLQTKKIIKRCAHKGVAINVFDDGSYTANVQGQQFILCV